MTLPRSVELRWQEDVIERWLHTPGVPADAHAKLLEMLSDLKDEMNRLTPDAKEVHGRGKHVVTVPQGEQSQPIAVAPAKERATERH